MVAVVFMVDMTPSQSAGFIQPTRVARCAAGAVNVAPSSENRVHPDRVNPTDIHFHHPGGRTEPLLTTGGKGCA